MASLACKNIFAAFVTDDRSAKWPEMEMKPDDHLRVASSVSSRWEENENKQNMTTLMWVFLSQQIVLKYLSAQLDLLRDG